MSVRASARAHRVADGWGVELVLTQGMAVRPYWLTPDQADALAAELTKYAQVCRGQYEAQQLDTRRAPLPSPSPSPSLSPAPDSSAAPC